jgi:plasmid stabilization system protein ParE
MKRDVVYHPKVPGEVREIYGYYRDVSEELSEDFWDHLMSAIDYAARFPERHHFDLGAKRRRSNLDRFPYHFLFLEFSDHIRITVVRHNKRTIGTKRR